MRSFYDIVECTDTASSDQLKKAYFDFLRREHPDKVSGKREFDVELLNAVSAIWNRVKTTEGRSEYDCWLREQRLRAAKGTIAEHVEIEDDELVVEEYCRCGDEFYVTTEDVGAEDCGRRGVRVLFMLPLSGSGEETEGLAPWVGASTKVIVLGDAEVGKTSFCHAVAGSPKDEFRSTIGANVVMAWHDYRAGTPEQRPELIELWDIGGTASHRPASQVFIDGAYGVILVHDLSNKRSEDNLGVWMTMLDGKQRTITGEPQQLDLESCHIPVLVVGCKADLVRKQPPGSYDRMYVNCRHVIQPGSPNAITLARFLDMCIDRSRNSAMATTIGGRRRVAGSANSSFAIRMDNSSFFQD